MNPNPVAAAARARQRKKNGHRFDTKPYRDRSADDVAAMLQRLLDKKRGAVVTCERGPALLTRKRMRLFRRGGLDFDGSLKKWNEGGRKEAATRRARAMRAKMLADKAGVEEAVEEHEERMRRRDMLRTGNARSLMHHWNIGTRFWEGKFLLFCFWLTDLSN